MKTETVSLPNSILVDLKGFCDESRTKKYCTTRWLTSPTFRVYVRHAWHVIHGVTRECFDIANVEAEPRGQGQFTEFLKEATKTNPWDGVYIENVLDQRFSQYFRSRGWLEVGAPDSCFYLPR